MLLRSLRRSSQPRSALLRGVRSRFPGFCSSACDQEAPDATAAEKASKQQQPVVETTWNTLVIGEIVDFHAHPQADRLNVCSVDIGDKENLLQIICGAPNVRQGARVPVAKVGTRLAIKEAESGELKKLKIKKSKLRGEVSQGMICSEAELGLTDESDGILIFEDDAEVGSLVHEHETIASRLLARGIAVPALQLKVAAVDSTQDGSKTGSGIHIEMHAAGDN
ncbi:hypothetical protein PHYBOEH_002711 [Phytophthora boehmeriae]|uniref:tRNA-binding domain-containing protein n=1 Tax=Phytophthora boehmeriae TaxID=109152 RepID=A0A8T1XAT9_9STRA|nr:hypothetical protein PHYBOEH_002711 [Phytophthora boehmeriae]